MRNFDFRIVLGICMLIIGLIFVLQAFDVIYITEILPLVWTAFFAIGGLIFLYFYSINRSQWWALIPGLSLIGVAFTVGLGAYGPEELDFLGGVVVLAVIALSFFLIYFGNREQWWALIPGGVLLSAALMVGLEPVVGEGVELASVFLLGTSLTFFVIAFLPTTNGRMTWALIPAFVLLIIAAVLFLAAVDATQFLWALGFIVLGGYMIYRLFSARRKA